MRYLRTLVALLPLIAPAACATVSDEALREYYSVSQRKAGA